MTEDTPQSDKKKYGYTANWIPRGERIVNIVSSVILFGYGTLGIIKDDLYIPGRYERPGMHLQGAATWIMYLACLCAIANMISVVVDHYDKRDNERNYRVFARITLITGLSLFVFSIVLRVFVFREGAQ